MTDEARIARLTELARRVWPQLGVSVSDVEAISDDTRVALVMTRTRDNIYNHPVKIVHPRALEALEAALLVLAGDVDRRDYEQAMADGYRPLLEKHEGLLSRIDQLAREWEEREAENGGYVRDPVLVQKGQTYGVCARRLRERAKAGR